MTICITMNGVGHFIGYSLAALISSTTNCMWCPFYVIMAAMLIPIVYLIIADASIIDIKEHLRLREEQ